MTNSTKKTTTRKPRATKPKVKAPTKSVELPTNPFVFEILEAVSAQRSGAKKVEVLKKYEDNSVKSVLIWNFDESVQSMLTMKSTKSMKPMKSMNSLKSTKSTKSFNP